MLARVPEALREVGLDGFERRRTSRLSGGEQQRVALGGVLAALPGILVLDEPTANLDPGGTTDFFARLAAIRSEATRRSSSSSTGSTLRGRSRTSSWRSMARAGRSTSGVPTRSSCDPACACAARGSGCPNGLLGPIPWACRPTRPARRLIEAHGVRFGYDHTDPILRDIDLVAGRAERIALVGPNGSGKSTLGRLLVGLLRPDHGTVLLGADDPSRLPSAELARRAGYVFQDPETQFLANTVADEVMLGLRPDERAASGDLMDRLGLPLGRVRRPQPVPLSGGEARRLSLACVLVRWPQVLVLDEPTFGQDRHGHEALVEIIRERLDTGICLFTATHDRRFVEQVADRIIELD